MHLLGASPWVLKSLGCLDLNSVKLHRRYNHGFMTLSAIAELYITQGYPFYNQWAQEGVWLEIKAKSKVLVRQNKGPCKILWARQKHQYFKLPMCDKMCLTIFLLYLLWWLCLKRDSTKFPGVDVLFKLWVIDSEPYFSVNHHSKNIAIHKNFQGRKYIKTQDVNWQIKRAIFLCGKPKTLNLSSDIVCCRFSTVIVCLQLVQIMKSMGTSSGCFRLVDPQQWLRVKCTNASQIMCRKFYHCLKK